MIPILALILTAAVLVGLTIGFIIFAMIMVKPVNKIFDWFNKKGWFD